MLPLFLEFYHLSNFRGASHSFIDALRDEQTKRNITELHFTEIEYSNRPNSKYALAKRWLEILSQSMSDFPKDLFIKFLGINAKELNPESFGGSTAGKAFYREYSRFFRTLIKGAYAYFIKPLRYSDHRYIKQIFHDNQGILEKDIDSNFKKQLSKALKEDPELKLKTETVEFVSSNPGEGNENSYLIELADLLVGLISHMYFPNKELSSKKKKARYKLAQFFKNEILKKYIHKKPAQVSISYFPENGDFYKPSFSKDAFNCEKRILK